MAAKKNNRTIVISILAVVIGMFMLAYAAEPLYRVFCKITGYGGTPKTATKPSSIVIDKYITVTFNADVDFNLPWKFKPDQNKVRIKLGENALTSYYAENLTNQPVVGMAVYNVTPEAAAVYFNKVHCFCFEQQMLQPHQKVHMPVSFFVDPEIVKDNNLKGIDTITLSYTFYRVKEKK